MTSERELVARWRDFLTRYSRTTCALDRALQEEHDIGLSEFEVLDLIVDLSQIEVPAQPEEGPSEKCRMNELASDTYLSQSALSRTVARLEKSGLVVRAMCDADRRSIFVQLTEAGRRLHEDARETHRTMLAKHLD